MAALTPNRSLSSELAPDEKKAHRKDQFKSRGTSNWKETYRERCSRRLKQSRQALFDSSRSHNIDPSQETVQQSVLSAMQQEWNQLRCEFNLPNITVPMKRGVESPLVEANLPKRPISNDDYMETIEAFTTPSKQLQGACLSDTLQDEDIEYILSVMDEITSELIETEQSIIAQHEENIRFDETSTPLGNNDEDIVICPICLKNALVQDNQFIYCGCGLRIDTKQDGVTLDYVRRQLRDGASAHSEVCLAPPTFKTDTIVGLQNLLMVCSVCNFMYIIL